MATIGKIPTFGFGAGEIKYATLGGFSATGSAISQAFDLRVFVQLTPGVWTDISDDLLSPDDAAGLWFVYGIQGNGPEDNVANRGELHFILDNSAGNSATTEGLYSPVHAACLSGWTFDIQVKVVCQFLGVEYTKFRGTIREILPEAGAYGTRRVYVSAFDAMADLAEADLREVDVQLDATVDDLLNVIADAVPMESQPVARAFDVGVDVFPYALYDLRGGVKALGAMATAVNSEFGSKLFQTGDGTLTFLNRHSVLLKESQFAFDDTQLRSIVVPSSLQKIYRKVFATINKKSVTPTPTEALYELPDGASIELAPGASTENFVDYTDPNDRKTKVGGYAVVDVLVAGTHYAGNSQSDALGADLSGLLTVTIDPFGTTAKWTFENIGSEVVYITKQTVIGRVIRNQGPQTLQSVAPGSTQRDRPLEINLEYQDDPYIGQSVADRTRYLWSALDKQLYTATFLANETDEFMVLALEREPCDVGTFSEQVTGISGVLAAIQSVKWEVYAGLQQVWCTYTLAPANAQRFWQWGVVGRSEWGETTVYA